MMVADPGKITGVAITRGPVSGHPTAVGCVKKSAKQNYIHTFRH